jgi:vacuolar-type H+-ATPase subunit E/Vma4
MSDSASKTAKDETSEEAQRRADDAALKVNEDAKPFAANLRSEILTRVHKESTTLDSLFDADALR